MSNFVVIGLSHQTAPLKLREITTAKSVEQKSLYFDLNSMFDVRELMILSTCNRIELYVVVNESERLREWFVQWAQIPTEHLASVYIHIDDVALNHLFRVAGSLDSMVLGESPAGLVLISI